MSGSHKILKEHPPPENSTLTPFPREEHNQPTPIFSQFHPLIFEVSVSFTSSVSFIFFQVTLRPEEAQTSELAVLYFPKA